MSVTRSLLQESHATSTLASNWSEWSSVQGPTDETLARGSSDCPCGAIRLVKFPRDVEKCCGEVLERSVVKKRCGELMARSVVERCCQEVLSRSAVEKCEGEVLWRSVAEKCCEGVLCVVEECCREVV